ncbi:TetR/AcrR family transcriptional regulator [Desulfovibrio sp. TomC]|uniref:TetR/AcrR family transcriptional regulator n=1 Tax=Desulfovibrio sp. TomC TaxID=1562888 RepID=UPI0005757ECD|nr:TetR/AcrR family transcriptional regulator [Desulfovibrio sp. TomC]KHK00814.1 transcriptional regulator, TetR family [Desulfovibrio sp. TomC]
MNETTRERILRTGAAIIHRQGYAATGLKEILDAAGTPKGSFYHYFPSKEAFVLAVIEYDEAWIGEVVRSVLARDDLSAVGRLQFFVERFESIQAEGGYRLGCPIGNLVQELGGQTEAFGQRLAVSLAGLSGFFEKLVLAGQATGEFDASLDAADVAGFLAGAWQGALLRMKVERSGEPLAAFARQAVRVLRPA